MDKEFFSKIDAYVIFKPANRFYFTKLHTSYGCLIITEKKRIFITDSRYEYIARHTLWDDEVLIATFSEMYSMISSSLKKAGVKSVGYEDEYLTVAEFKNFKTALDGFTLKPASKQIEASRWIKTKEEIDNISAAQQIAQKALTKILPLLKVGVTEKDIAAELNYELLMQGGQGAAFDTIVAFGENSAIPHHQPDVKKLDKNDMILLDFGAVYNGYCSDMTRTFCLSLPNEELQTAHSVVLEAQKYVLKHMKAGMTCMEADSLAREYITANGYGNEFGHALGHGVGIDIHEPPRLGKGVPDVLLPGMVVTVEPGVYIDGFGGVRIEDMVVIKEDGIINLTNFNKNIIL